jgi:hypothetical protein
MIRVHPGGAALSLLALLALSPPALPAAATTPADSAPQPEGAALPPYLADRGRGMAVSLFGTYVRKGEWLVYAFHEYTKTSSFEYTPEELGFPGNEDRFGTLTEREELLFVSYGITERLEVEIEGALQATASLEKGGDDISAVPDRLKESGLGDVEGHIRFRWAEEGPRRPELFSFFEAGFPFQRDNVLLGIQDWQYALGFGAIKGHRWGTLTARVSLAYDQADAQLEFGEYAVEYLKRLSPTWRFVAAVEAETDEVQLILEGQARLGRHVLLKLNSGFGVTRKAPDVAPEIGLLFSF